MLKLGRYQPQKIQSSHLKGYDLHKVAQLSTSIDEMDAVTLNYWLGKFVMEATKKWGQTYPRKTVYGIVCDIRRYQR